LIVSVEELTKIVDAIVAKLLIDKRGSFTSETLEIMVKELVDKKIAEALDQHLQDYEHKEKMLTVEEIENGRT
jgi:hypothetical protein